MIYNPLKNQSYIKKEETPCKELIKRLGPETHTKNIKTGKKYGRKLCVLWKALHSTHEPLATMIKFYTSIQPLKAVKSIF